MVKEKITHILSSLLKKRSPGGDLKSLLTQAAQNPEDLRLQLQIGKWYFKHHQVEQGIETYREVAEKYLAEEFFLKAIAVYKEILKYSPGSVEFNEKLGDLFLQVGLLSDAIQQYQIVLHYHLNHQQGEDALRLAKKLVEANPEEPRHRMRVAEIYTHEGKDEEALAVYESLAKDLRREMKPLNLLVEVYEKLLLRKPKEMQLLRELCVFYLKQKKPQKTIKKIERFQLEKDEQFKPIYEKALQLKKILEKAL